MSKQSIEHDKQISKLERKKLQWVLRGAWERAREKTLATNASEKKSTRDLPLPFFLAQLLNGCIWSKLMVLWVWTCVGAFFSSLSAELRALSVITFWYYYDDYFCFWCAARVRKIIKFVRLFVCIYFSLCSSFSTWLFAWI